MQPFYKRLTLHEHADRVLCHFMFRASLFQVWYKFHESVCQSSSTPELKLSLSEIKREYASRGHIFPKTKSMKLRLK